jgi:hypothetical protein
LWFGLLTAIFDGVLRPSWIGVDRPMSTAETWLATMIASVSQSLITLLIVKQFVGLRGPILPEIGLLALAACAGLALGKLIVTLFRRSDFILGAAILTFAALILFTKGPLVPAIISETAPSRWAYEGLLLIEVAPQLPAHGDPRLPGLSQLHGVSACSLALGLMLVGFGGAAIFLNRENPPASPQTAAF